MYLAEMPDLTHEHITPGRGGGDCPGCPKRSERMPRAVPDVLVVMMGATFKRTRV